uniref:Uncharacterized protein n=1 Tax=Lactuca sativa TaxID=4236 RepID=A0A9R1WV94_LACSA|nr:hypothetical protein LSAT_V11C900474890 [Lactuca sativa]
MLLKKKTSQMTKLQKKSFLWPKSLNLTLMHQMKVLELLQLIILKLLQILIKTPQRKTLLFEKYLSHLKKEKTCISLTTIFFTLKKKNLLIMLDAFILFKRKMSFFSLQYHKNY